MRKHRIRNVGYDIFCIFSLRMKMIRKDSTTLFVLLSSVVLFTLMFRTLSIAAEDQSAIPVGIVDYDKSSSSKQLIADLKKVPAMRIVEKDEEELYRLMKDEMVTSLFILEDGYEQKLVAGDLKDIITMYYMEDNKAASVLSDILAGEMIYSICYFKSFKLYKQISFEGTKHSESQYKEYFDHLLVDNKDFDFAFHMIYVNPKKRVTLVKPLTNSVIYKQLIFGILGILIALIAMFIISGTVREKEIGVEERLKISRFHPLIRDGGNFLALIFTEGVISLIYSILIFSQIPSRDIKLWASSFLLLLVNALVLGGLFILIAKFTRSMILYQMISSIFILLTGGLGFYCLLTGFYQSVVDSMIKFIPNNWFIQGFTDIIIYGNSGGYLKEGHRVLLLMAAVVIILVVALDLLEGFSIIKSKRNKNRTVN